MDINEDYRIAIGKRLKAARRSIRITQEKMAEQIGVSQKHYSEVERGLAGLSVKNLILISDILEISLDYLLKGKSQKAEGNSYASTVNEIFNSVPEHTQQQMIRLLEIALNMIQYSKKN